MFEGWAEPSPKLVFRPDEVYRAPTDDGAAIALGRYHARGGPRFVEPVVLSHGLGSNRFHLDFNERYSLARYLARRGFESWVLELRGRGLAGPAGDFNLDDQAEHDVGAALRVVRSSGTAGGLGRKVSWVGHSKGGLLVYAHLARNPAAPLNAVVTLGSPATFRPQAGLQRFVRTIAPVLSGKLIPTGRIRQLSSVLLGNAPPDAVSRYLLSPERMEPQILKLAMAHLPSDIAGGVARQLADWVLTDRFSSLDGAVDYRQRLAAARMPLLLIAGTEDFLAPPEAVLRARAYWGGPVETSILDFGHADLVLGQQAPEVVFPRIAEFLERNSTPL